MVRVKPGRRTLFAVGGALAVGAFVAADFALRGAAAPWWAAVGGSDWVLHPILDGLGFAGVLGALFVAARDAKRWPLAALLLATAAIMMPIGLVLAFGFHDAKLAAAWACVTIVPLTIATGLLARHRVAYRLAFLPVVATYASATALLGAAGLA